MALNKLDLVNKVRQMRDVIDGTIANNSGDRLPRPAAAVTNTFNVRNGTDEGVNEDESNRGKTRTSQRNGHSKQQRQEINTTNSNNDNFLRASSRRINPIDEADETMLRPAPPPLPAQAQCTTSNSKGPANVCSQHGTQFNKTTREPANNKLPSLSKVETSLKQLEAHQNNAANQHLHHHHHLQHSTRAVDCGAKATKFTHTVAKHQMIEPMVQSSNHYIQHQQCLAFQHHAAAAHACMDPKLLFNGGGDSSAPNHRFTKQHQPHCIYHNKHNNPNCPNSKLPADGLGGHLDEVARRKQQQQPPSKHRSSQSQDKYLLVDLYRPSELHANNRSHLPHHQSSLPSGSPSGSCSKGTFIKFISQLYFLLHLSAILSLLMHHKNLVISESKSQSQPGAHLVKLGTLANDTAVPATAATTISPIVNPLPVPLMLMAAGDSGGNYSAATGGYSGGPQNHILSSVVVSTSSPATGNRLFDGMSSSTKRFGRQAAASNVNYQQQHLLSQVNPDILVRLVGEAHARHALRYFLSYLLISSVIVLVCLRLFRLCNWRRAKRKFARSSSNSNEQSSANQQQQQQQLESDNYGFYQRTRLVLIGSISLGLIQLIVIGLDIAYNIDWLNESHRPPTTSLPFLQFVFVSLLMQYILGKVAKKRGSSQRKSITSDGPNKHTTTAREDAVALSIMNSAARARYSNSSNNSEPTSSNNSGFENIALAHLLVTHILLWLMKLNSISLFQAIEQQQQQQHSTSRQQQQRHQQSISNKLFPPPGSPSDGAQSTGAAAYPTPYNAAGADLTMQSVIPLAKPIGRAMMQPPHGEKFIPPIGSTVLDPAIIRHPGIPGQADKSLRTADRAPQTTTRPLAPDASISSVEPPPVAPNITATTSQPVLLDPHSNKGERGHRSATSADAASPLPVSPNSRWASPSSGQSNATGSASSQQPAVNASNSANKFKSLLPKRMTAFRQRPPSSVTIGLPASTTTTLAPQTSAAPNKQRARVMIHRVEDPVHLESPETEAARRRRAKLASTTSTERPFPSVETGDPLPVLTSTTPSSIHTAPTIVKSTTIKASSSSGHQPSGLGFRSLRTRHTDYDTLASSVTSATNQTLKPTPDLPQPDVELPGPVENPAIGSTKGAKHYSDAIGEETPEAGGDVEDDIEDAEIDLDALLPPVPNYNDVAQSDEYDVARQHPQAASVESSYEAPALMNETENIKAKAMKAFDLNDDAFVFNEAASEIVNTSVLPPEALVMASSAGGSQEQQQRRQQQQNEQKGQPTFADYLMPIVHQYHILIAAILFNMWLDGLGTVGGSPKHRAQTRQAVPHAHQDISFSNKRLISRGDMLLASGGTCSSSSDLLEGSILSSDNSSSRGLVAIPIGGHKKRRGIEHAPESRYISPLAGFALDRFHKSSNGGHWRHLSERHHGERYYQPHTHHRSRSMDSLHLVTRTDESTSSSGESTLSRRHSVRSASSQQLLWVSGGLRGNAGHRRARSPLLGRQVLAPFSMRQPRGAGLTRKSGRQQVAISTLIAADSLGHQGVNSQTANSVCSVFFGLIVVSITLIVILVGIDLLSVVAQCLTQLISIIVCLIGLFLLWRLQARANRAAARRCHTSKKEARLCYRRRLLHLTAAEPRLQRASGDALAGVSRNNRQCFHYLFLLAAYYCGISIALNLSKQYSMQQLFSQQVIQFIHRHFIVAGQNKFPLPIHEPLISAHHHHQAATRQQPDLLSASLTNYLFLFHLILIVKGLLLIVQVTLQTLLIRTSCQRVTKELRQIYTFLMFANLSLWALEICEQQQHLQRADLDSAHRADTASDDRYKLISLDSFTRFAASIVTLSHLYHGLVFMQQ